MNEPRRLLEDGGDDLGRALLRSARRDAPSPHARKKTMIALGLAGGVSATVTAATATSTATTLAKATTTVAMLKWIGAGVIGGLVTIGAVTVVQSRSAPPAPPPTAPVQAAAPLPVEPPAAAPAPAAPPVEEAPTAKPVEAPRPSAKPVEKPSLTEEVAALDAAREALGSGNAAGALRALDEHDRRFPGGALGPEALVLRIEALVQRGDRATATRLGRAFLDAHPHSALAGRIRSLIGAPEPAPSP